MKDIRMLTLMKQHYMDKYSTPLECQMSCWGYYDGVNITKPEKTNSPLFEKRTQSPISELWYGTMQRASHLKGKHSEQNIGLFRNEDELSKAFWKEFNRTPYFMVGFLQLEDSMRYKECAKEIEAKYQRERTDGKDVQVGTIVYYTFDNADLVIMIQSNSIHALEKSIREIEDMSQIRYFHSIMGISEAYLKDCKKEGEVLKIWKDTNCMLQEKLPKITIKFVTSGDRELESRIRKEWKMPVSNVRSTFVTGHESMVMDIRDTNVEMLVQLLLPEGFSTHQNSLYNKGLVYNIETGFCTQQMNWENVPALETDEREMKVFILIVIRCCRR